MLPARQLASRQHCSILKFLGMAAAHTHQMMVITVGIISQLIASATFRKFQLLKQPHRTEQPQGAVNRGQRHPLLLGQQALVHLLSTEVAADADVLEQGQDSLPLGREALAAIMKTGLQGFAVDQSWLGTARQSKRRGAWL